jgi:hypothetical protein
MTAVTALASTMLTMLPNVTSIPVHDLANWTEAAYRGIPPNRVTVENGALSIDVRDSASPLIYRFDRPLRLTGFSVEASWSGELEIPAGVMQGGDGADDFVLKLGLVVAGDRTLGWFERRVAADWLLRLYELAPKDGGIENVRFYSTTRQRDLIGTSRTHPLSKLLYEERIAYLAHPGPFSLSRSFGDPIETLGLWIASDGDDTESELQVKIHGILLKIADR